MVDAAAANFNPFLWNFQWAASDKPQKQGSCLPQAGMSILSKAHNTEFGFLEAANGRLPAAVLEF